MVDVGHGPPLVLVPGIHGRWEYLRPAIEALARSFRVLTFPLRGERASGQRIDPSLGLDNDAGRIGRALDDRGIRRAVICGISYGGLPAIRFAAEHPERTAALVLASTPGPAFHLRARHRVYVRVPWLFAPLFLIESPLRLRHEIAAAFPSMAARWRFVRWHLGALAAAPMSPSRMALRAALIAAGEIERDCVNVTAPTLVITGQPRLDRVVNVAGTMRYLTLIAGSRHATLAGTGHLGSITKPEAFAAIVAEFVGARVREDPPYGDTRATA